MEIYIDERQGIDDDDVKLIIRARERK